MIELKARTEQDAKREAVNLSEHNPGRYVIVFACFGLFASLSKRLGVFAPSDATFNWYVLNGKIKSFSTSQHVACQNATPSLS